VRQGLGLAVVPAFAKKAATPDGSEYHIMWVIVIRKTTVTLLF
jgi:hypothetical protein